MKRLFHLRGYGFEGTSIKMGCAVWEEESHTAILSIHREEEPNVGCILSEPLLNFNLVLSKYLLTPTTEQITSVMVGFFTQLGGAIHTVGLSPNAS